MKKKIKKNRPMHDYDYLALKYKFLEKHVYLNNLGKYCLVIRSYDNRF